jgi:hypothetical protein
MIKAGVEGQMAILDTTMVRRVEVFLPDVTSIDGWTLWEPVCDGQWVRPPAETQETSSVPQQPLTIACDDVPLDDARRISRGACLDPELSHALKQNIQAAGPYRPPHTAP